MEIKKVYKTSKGLFWTKEDAEKNCYEPVREAYVLIAEVKVNAGVRGFGRADMVFELNPVEIL